MCRVAGVGLEGVIVRLLNSMTKWLVATGIAAVCLGLVAWVWFHGYRTDSVVPTHSYPLQTGQTGEWTTFGGGWDISNGIVHNKSSDVRGAKLITGSKNWKNYTLSADIQFDRDGGDMGTLIRSNDEQEGLDSYNGYYVGLRMDGGDLIIGRSNYGWIEARPVALAGGVHPAVWYRLRVTAYKCNIAASAQNLETLQTAWIAFEERSCVKTAVAQCEHFAGGMERLHGVTAACFFGGAAGGFEGATVVDALVGGWQASAIATFYSGPWVTLGSSQNLGAFVNQLPYVTGAINNSSLHGGLGRNGRLGPYFNTQNVQPITTLGVQGNAGVSNVQTPGSATWDLSAFKTWRFADRYGATFRTDFFNAFNRVNFINMNTNVNDSNFGNLTGANAPREIQFSMRLAF
jgi:hypothetical protein